MAGLYSTMPDCLRFIRMLLGRGTLDGVRILLEVLIEHDMRNEIAPLQITTQVTATPYSSHDVEFFPGTPNLELNS